MATLNKQIWTRQLMQNFYPEGNFLQYVRNFSGLVEYDKLHMAEVGLDPDVLINNTTYPISVSQRIDRPIEIELDLFETENTLVRQPDAVELSYEKLESVLYGHKQTLRTASFKRAAHAFAPAENDVNTPVIETTGATSDGYKRLVPADILLLKRKFDEMDIPIDGRYLVLDPRHTEDLILFDLDVFKNITDFVNGAPKRFAGFNLLEFSKNPLYDSATNEKIAFDAVPTGDVSHCSFAFHKDEVMKADGNVKMYIRRDDPEERATVVGFDKRFIALPIRGKGIGAIVAKKV